MPLQKIHEQGFTLLEMSIVLVIIGLIVGGILVGRDLINAAAVRAQITQIERYNTAVNKFHDKYGGLPGDLQVSLVNQFGFPTDTATCDGSAGARDGNGLIERNSVKKNQLFSEISLFWSDLSAANLIEGTFPNSGAPAITCGTPGLEALTMTPGTAYVGDYVPVGRIGGGNFITVYSYNGINWYSLQAITSVNTVGMITPGNTTLSVIQAYNIDKKIDDGMPTTGAVQAAYVAGITGPAPAPVNAQVIDSGTSCYNTT
jgi:prepilin-type N-terminal cleavage/methylation domain-containing protein